jgi:DNA-binding NtrC family response regulator
VKIDSPLFESNTQGATEEKEMIYKFLFEVKKDIHDLKKLVLGIIDAGVQGTAATSESNQQIIHRLFKDSDTIITQPASAESYVSPGHQSIHTHHDIDHHVEVEESLSLTDKEKDLIDKALEKHRGRRKNAAAELGISERTLYRKIKEYGLKG